MPKFSSVTCPCGLRKAPTTMLSVGKIRNSRAKRKKGATPNQLSICLGCRADGRDRAIVVIGVFPTGAMGKACRSKPSRFLRVPT
ncbi:hypothetical protein GCM10023067_21490 [Aminobacter aganoensis]